MALRPGEVVELVGETRDSRKTLRAGEIDSDEYIVELEDLTR